MKYISNIVNNVFSQIINIGVGILISVIVARSLGAFDKGYIEYLILIFAVLGQFGDLGLVGTTTYYQKKVKVDENDVYNINITFLNLLWIILGLIVIFTYKFTNVFEGYSPLLVILGIISILFTFLFGIMKSVLIGQEKIKEINLIVRRNNYIKLIFIIIFAYYNILDIIMYFAIRVFFLLINAYCLNKKIETRYKIKFNFSLLKSEMSFSLIVYLASLFIYLNYRADQFMIRSFIGNTELGIYSVAVVLAELLFLIPNSIKSALLGMLYNQEDNVNSNAVIEKTIKFTTIISIFISMGFIFFSGLIEVIYGEEYKEAAKVLMILLPGIVFASIGKIAGNYFVVSGKPKVHLVITFLTFLINIILNAFLIPIFGIYGAGFASTVSYAFYGIVYMIRLVKYENFNLKNCVLISKNEINMMKNLVFRRPMNN